MRSFFCEDDSPACSAKNRQILNQLLECKSVIPIFLALYLHILPCKWFIIPESFGVGPVDRLNRQQHNPLGAIIALSIVIIDFWHSLQTNTAVAKKQISLSITFSVKQGETESVWASTDEETRIELSSCGRFYSHSSGSAEPSKTAIFHPTVSFVGHWNICEGTFQAAQLLDCSV